MAQPKKHTARSPPPIDIKSMQIRLQVPRHPKFPCDESKLSASAENKNKESPSESFAAMRGKYECPHCKVTTPDIKSMQIHSDARHGKFPLDQNNKLDRLSSLPDDILINNILSRLLMLEAQRTSVLARTWRHLWSYLPCLDFEYRPQKAASEYVKWVDQTIDAYRGGTAALRHFRALFSSDRDSSKIDSWLDFSLGQGVEVLELDFRYTFYTFLWVSPSQFPNIRLLKSLILGVVEMPNDSLEDLLLTCEFLERLDLAHVFELTQVNVTGPVPRLEHLHVEGCVCLKLVTIHQVNVTGPVSRLKHIHIDGCYFVKSITIQAPSPDDLVSFAHPGHNPERLDLAHVTGPVSKLKHIHIDSCNRVESIMIQAPTPDLVSFTYPHEDVQITLQHAPRLVDLLLYVFYPYCAKPPPLFRYLSQLEVLHLVYDPWERHEGIYPWHDFPVLSRLKHLKFVPDGDGASERLIRDQLRCLAWLIEIAPCLQLLTLDVSRVGEFFESGMNREETDDMLLGLGVRVLEIAGFQGFRHGDCELALHLIRASPSLEKLIIGHRSTIPESYKPRRPYEHFKNGRKGWEEVVKEVIELELPSEAKLVLL